MTTKITFVRVVRAEWTKLCSLRSTWITLGVTAPLTVGLAGAIGYGVGRTGAPPTAAEAVSAAFLPIDFLLLVIAVLGVLQISGEYGSGLVRATLAAVPTRLPVLYAKALAQTALTAPVMVVACLASFAVCQALIGDGAASLSDPGVLRAIAGAAASTVLTGLLGLGVGAAVRSTAAGIATLVTLLYVVPLLIGPVLPGTREDEVLKYLPTVAGQAMYSVDGKGGPFEILSPGASAVVLVGWAVLLLAGGAAVLLRRDA